MFTIHPSGEGGACINEAGVQKKSWPGDMCLGVICAQRAFKARGCTLAHLRASVGKEEKRVKSWVLEHLNLQW